MVIGWGAVQPRTGYRWLLAGVVVVLSAQSFLHLAAYQHAPLLLAAWPVIVLIAFRWPIVGIFAAAAFLRIGFLEVCCTDQILVSQAAWERVSSGAGGPYGVGYAATIPPGSPFPYGPLALLWWIPGPAVELVAAFAIMAVLAWQRALVTLAVFAVWQPAVWLTVVGVNDYSPGLLILVAWLMMRERPVVGAVVLAAAAALKPYAFAWFLPAIGYGGVSVAVALIAASGVLWAPMLLWWGGIGPFLRTVDLASHTASAPNALNLPALRWIALPVMAAGLLTRRWEWAVLTGSAAFIAFLFMARWASYSYWLAVLPVSGLAIERLMLPQARRDIPSPTRRLALPVIPRPTRSS